MAEPDTEVLSAVAATCPICLLLNRPVKLVEAIGSEQCAKRLPHDQQWQLRALISSA
jgi:hypothetical protein